jgi:hypothetical protein
MDGILMHEVNNEENYKKKKVSKESEKAALLLRDKLANARFGKEDNKKDGYGKKEKKWIVK